MTEREKFLEEELERERARNKKLDPIDRNFKYSIIAFGMMYAFLLAIFVIGLIFKK